MDLQTPFSEALARIKDISTTVGQAEDAKAQAYISNQSNKVFKKLGELKKELPTDLLDDYEDKMEELAHDILRLNIPHHNLYKNIAGLIERYRSEFPELVPMFEKARTMPQIRKAVEKAANVVKENPLAVIDFEQLQTEPAIYYKVEGAYGKDNTAHIVNRVAEIEANAQSMEPKKKQSYIHTQCARLATQIHKKLGWVVDKRTGLLKVDNPKAKANTYVWLMGRYRSAIKSLGYRHHAFEYHAGALVDKFSKLYPCLNLEKKLNPKLSIAKLRENIVKLKKADGLVKGSELSKALSNLHLEHYAFYAFEPVAIAAERVEKQTGKALESKLNLQTEVNPNWVVGTSEGLVKDGIKDLADWLAIPPKVRPRRTQSASLIVGLAMACGRRLTEVIKTGKFVALQNEENWVVFSGQLKTKYRYLFEDLKPYHIPILIDRGLFLEGMEVLRKFMRTETVKIRQPDGEYIHAKVLARMNDAEHNKAVKDKFAPHLNTVIKRIMGSPEFTFKDTRAIYAAIGSELFNAEKVNRLAWAKKYLGHADEESDTAKHYLGFEVTTDVDSVNVIHGSRKAEKRGGSADSENIDKAWLDFLERCDDEIKSYRRAPTWWDLHCWLKDQVSNGLTREYIYGQVVSSNRKTNPVAWLRSYIRKGCLVNGKSLSPTTVSSYLTGAGLGMNERLEF